MKISKLKYQNPKINFEENFHRGIVARDGFFKERGEILAEINQKVDKNY